MGFLNGFYEKLGKLLETAKDFAPIKIGTHVFVKKAMLIWNPSGDDEWQGRSGIIANINPYLTENSYLNFAYKINRITPDGDIDNQLVSKYTLDCKESDFEIIKEKNDSNKF